MCKHGNTILTPVAIPDDLSHTGTVRIKLAAVDSCIAGIVKALSWRDIATRSSCCGHGKGTGEILLQDGRRLEIHNAGSK